ncbi:MAG: type II CRISPR RNA-guided endonuclease Cas9 [Bacteroidetes bacterium]|nr:type II CRISPR RNA-guided endonuclease Cas9 [Bacteroidota bacterium]
MVTSYIENDGTIKKDKKGKEERSFFLKEDLSLIKKKPSKTTKKRNEKVEEVSLKIIEVKEEKQEKVWYSLALENGWIYRRESKTPLFDWKDKVREFIVTTDLNDDGTVKTDNEGKESRSYRSPKEDDWTLVKTKTENDLCKYIGSDKKTKTVGTYIYEALLKNPTQKIRGKLVRTIEREYYKDELKAILEKQIALQPELFTEDLYNTCVRELYKSNEAHQQQLNSKNDFVHLFLDDIIFYQRPLRSQKSSIGNCTLEFREYKRKDENGKEIEVKEYLKAIPKSNPYYQEFRVWQWLYNLKIYTKTNDEDVTVEFLKSTEDLEKLFEFLMSEKEVDHKKVLKYFFKDLKGKAQTTEIAKYRWNYVYDSEKDESKNYPMNETGYEIRRRLKEIENVPADFLKQVDEKEVEITKKNEQTGEREKTGKKMVLSLDSREYQLWHIIYSVTDKNEYEKALKTFAVKYKLDETSFVEEFKKFKPFPSEYGAYSEKAIKKLLPLMRLGKYWKWENIDAKTQTRIDKLLTGEFDAEIQNRVREKAINLTEQNHFQGLQLWLAQYVVYDRHSEAADIGKWNSVEDLKRYLNEFKQHSLRNPIVEQVITETLRVIGDIWRQYGNGAKDFFSEIHIELGREMKNTADDRAAITKQVTENENTNQRIKLLLIEFASDDYFKNKMDYSKYCNNENDTHFYKIDKNPIRQYSQSQLEILKIYEEGVLNSGIEIPNDVSEILKKFKESEIKKQPTKTEINRYKLWLEQKYKSPYTGEIIPLSKLFTPAYEIEHIIPQSRYFDDSLSNKVICEEAVNKLKGNQLGLEFIKNHYGQKVATDGNKTVTICTEEQYRKFIEEHYAKNKAKRNKLLLEDIPDKMIERQLNDTRYISKYISQLLSNIVRIDDEKAKKIVEEGEKLANKEQDKAKANKIREKAKSAANDDGVNSKNIIPVNGKITSQLKQDWGLNNVWNELILPRFERMNRLTNSSSFTTKNKQGHTIPAIPFELSKGFQMKRIDHRHHAMDALVIACTTRDHVNLLNNESAKSEIKRYDLKRKLKRFENTTLTKMAQDSNDIWIEVNAGEKEVPKEFLKPWATFTTDAKNELEKIIVSFKQNLRVINKATNHYEKIENGKKIEVEQKGVNWAVRKPMHKETVSGKIELPRIKVPKGKILTATRKSIDTSFVLKTIESITDTGIQKILKNYLKAKGNNPELAFSPEGLEDLNKNIAQYNEGKLHQPIYKARIFVETATQFQVGQKGNKKHKYVTAADGTNLFFVVYENKDTKVRMFDTVPLNEVIEHQKLQVSSNVEESKRTDVPTKNVLEHNNKEIEVNYLFHLSPNDLVYVPTEEELGLNAKIDFDNLTNEQRKRIYKFTDGSGTIANFIPVYIANVLFNMNKEKQKKAFGREMFAIQNEIGVGSQGSKNQNAITGEQIKSICIKLQVDRLGNILPAKKK